MSEKRTLEEWLRGLSTALRDAHRFVHEGMATGAEGRVYVQLSDELATIIADSAEQYAAELSVAHDGQTEFVKGDAW